MEQALGREELLYGTEAEEETSLFYKKRSRRVSFADTTSVHVYVRDEDMSTPPDSNPDQENDASSREDSPRTQDEEMEEPHASTDADDGGPQHILFSMESPGTANDSVTSKDEDKYFGPVSTSFIRSRALTESPSADDITLDSTAFSMQFGKLLQSGELSKSSSVFPSTSDCDKTPTENLVFTDSGSKMVLTEDKGLLTDSSKISLKFKLGSVSNEMSFVTDETQKYDYAKLSPKSGGLLSQYHKYLLSSSGSTTLGKLSKVNSPIRELVDPSIKGSSRVGGSSAPVSQSNLDHHEFYNLAHYTPMQSSRSTPPQGLSEVNSPVRDLVHPSIKGNSRFGGGSALASQSHLDHRELHNLDHYQTPIQSGRSPTTPTKLSEGNSPIRDLVDPSIKGSSRVGGGSALASQLHLDHHELCNLGHYNSPIRSNTSTTPGKLFKVNSPVKDLVDPGITGSSEVGGGSALASQSHLYLHELCNLDHYNTPIRSIAENTPVSPVEPFHVSSLLQRKAAERDGFASHMDTSEQVVQMTRSGSSPGRVVSVLDHQNHCSIIRGSLSPRESSEVVYPSSEKHHKIYQNAFDGHTLDDSDSIRECIRPATAVPHAKHSSIDADKIQLAGMPSPSSSAVSAPVQKDRASYPEEIHQHIVSLEKQVEAVIDDNRLKQVGANFDSFNERYLPKSTLGLRKGNEYLLSTPLILCSKKGLLLNETLDTLGNLKISTPFLLKPERKYTDFIDFTSSADKKVATPYASLDAFDRDHKSNQVTPLASENQRNGDCVLKQVKPSSITTEVNAFNLEPVDKRHRVDHESNCTGDCILIQVTPLASENQRNGDCILKQVKPSTITTEVNAFNLEPVGKRNRDDHGSNCTELGEENIETLSKKYLKLSCLNATMGDALATPVLSPPNRAISVHQFSSLGNSMTSFASGIYSLQREKNREIPTKEKLHGKDDTAHVIELGNSSNELVNPCIDEATCTLGNHKGADDTTMKILNDGCSLLNNFVLPREPFPSSLASGGYTDLCQVEDALEELQEVIKYRKLSAKVLPQKTRGQLENVKLQRNIRANLLCLELAYERLKFQILDMKQNILHNNLQQLGSGLQESRNLKVTKHSFIPEQIAGMETCDSSLASFNNSDKLAIQRVGMLRQEFQSLDEKVKKLVESQCRSCELKGSLDPDETLALVEDCVKKRRCCTSAATNLQLWKMDDVEFSHHKHTVLLKYGGFLSQRFDVDNESPLSSTQTLYSFNESFIEKVFPSINACVAFRFVLSSESLRAFWGIMTIQQEVEAVGHLLGNLLHILEEVQFARLQLPCLLLATFDDSSAGKLELRISLIGCNMERKATLVFDATELKQAVYPSESIPSPVLIETAGQSASESLPSAEILDAIQNLDFGSLRITRICQVVCELLNVNGCSSQQNVVSHSRRLY